MPGADLIRFEHVQALVRSGHAAVLRSFVSSVAQGRVPAEARPYVYGGRLVAPAKPGGGAHRPLGMFSERAMLALRLSWVRG